jgi:hypothetical protein
MVERPEPLHLPECQPEARHLPEFGPSAVEQIVEWFVEWAGHARTSRKAGSTSNSPVSRNFPSARPADLSI